jgi:hypothetical protein
LTDTDDLLEMAIRIFHLDMWVRRAQAANYLTAQSPPMLLFSLTKIYYFDKFVAADKAVFLSS